MRSQTVDTQTRLEEHRLYLDRIVREGEISRPLADAAWDVLLNLLDTLGPNLEIPDAIPGVDGKLFYTWKRDGHYLELEMRPDFKGEFFFRDGESGDVWSEDFRLGESLSPEVIAELRLFQPAGRSTEQ
jgi:hypothetical protein